MKKSKRKPTKAKSPKSRSARVRRPAARRLGRRPAIKKPAIPPMSVTMAASDFGAYYLGVATIRFSVADFTAGGNAHVTVPAGAQTFRFDATAGSFAQHALFFSLSDAALNVRFQAAPVCQPGVPNTTPVQGSFIASPLQGNFIADVQWNGLFGVIAVGWTWLKS